MLIETSVLISFLKIQRLDLLSKLDRELCITEEVNAEIRGDRYPFQRQHLETHLEAGTISILRIELTETLVLKAKLRALGPFGTGECSTVAKALELGLTCAMTDIDAIKRFKEFYPELRIVTTSDVFFEMLTEGLASVDEVDLVLPSWKFEAQNPIPGINISFRELLESEWPMHGIGGIS